MSKTIKVIVLGVSFLLATFVVAGGLGVKANTNDDGSYRQLGVYSEVLSRIRTEYVEDPNIPAVTDGALHGLLESLDANSSYLDPTEYKEYKQRKEGKAGIGAAVSKRYGYAAVISVEEEAYLLDAVGRYLRVPIDPASVVWRYAGVRPLRDDAR